MYSFSFAIEYWITFQSLPFPHLTVVKNSARTTPYYTVVLSLVRTRTKVAQAAEVQSRFEVWGENWGIWITSSPRRDFVLRTGWYCSLRYPLMSCDTYVQIWYVYNTSHNNINNIIHFSRYVQDWYIIIHWVDTYKFDTYYLCSQCNAISIARYLIRRL